jgi:hypothetical protein
MNTAATAPSLEQQPHPAPHRSRVSPLATWFAVLAAPVAWNLQQLVDAATAAHGCYPHDEPVGAPLWHSLAAVALWVNVLACVVCIAAGLVAWRNWRSTLSEGPGSANRLLGGGEGRTRFLAMAGLMSSGLFLVAVLFAAGGLLIVGTCTI